MARKLLDTDRTIRYKSDKTPAWFQAQRVPERGVMFRTMSHNSFYLDNPAEVRHIADKLNKMADDMETTWKKCY